MNENSYTYPEIPEIEALLRSFQPVPGAAYHHRMASAPWRASSPDSRKPLLASRRTVLVVIVTIVLLLTALGFTPAGKALANEILHFFTRAAGNTLPLPADQILPKVPTITPEPTYFPALLPADEVAEQHKEPTAVPTPILEGNQLQDLDSTTARTLAGFNLLEPAVLPADYRLQNIRFDPDQQAVYMQYASPLASTGEFFSITQGRNLSPFEIGADARVETITARGQQIELTRGGWFTLDGASESTWESSAEIYTLRWEEDGITTSMGFYLNEPTSPVYLQQDDMVAIINGLTTCRSTTSEKDYTCEVGRAAAAAGFEPWQFSQAPDGYSFNSVYYKPGLTAIWYASAAGELGVLQSRDDFKTNDSISDWFSVPDDAIQHVTVSGQQAEYVSGGFTAKAGEDHATWDPDSGQIRLRWKQGEYWFQIVKWGAPEMQPQELADLAATLSGDSIQIDGDQQDQSEPISYDTAYLSIDEVEKAYGKKVLSPSILPDGLPFSHARILPYSGPMLFYGDFAANKMRVNGDHLVISQGDNIGAFANSFDDYPPEAIETTTVNGIPAKLISGFILLGYDETGQPEGEPEWKDTPFRLALYWETSDHYYEVQFNAGYRSGARISKEDLTAIAESLQ